MRETRWQLELAQLLGDPVFRGVGLPRGDGRAVMLMPGLGGGDPLRRYDLPRVILAPGEEIALEKLRSERFGQVFETGAVFGAVEIGIVGEPRGDKGA